jgi:acyl dehydratase
MVLRGHADLVRHVGADLGVSSWYVVTQEQVDGFADATDDHNWLHVDPVRAAAGPFGAPIAHGFLTLALITRMLAEVVQIVGVRMKLNYGLDRVRFIDVVPVGARVRLKAAIAAAEQRADGMKVSFALEMERDGGTRPVLAALLIIRTYDGG